MPSNWKISIIQLHHRLVIHVGNKTVNMKASGFCYYMHMHFHYRRPLQNISRKCLESRIWRLSSWNFWGSRPLAHIFSPPSAGDYVFLHHLKKSLVTPCERQWRIKCNENDVTHVKTLCKLWTISILIGLIFWSGRRNGNACNNKIH
jgi:hypothetical protein